MRTDCSFIIKRRFSEDKNCYKSQNVLPVIWLQMPVTYLHNKNILWTTSWMSNISSVLQIFLTRVFQIFWPLMAMSCDKFSLLLSFSFHFQSLKCVTRYYTNSCCISILFFISSVRNLTNIEIKNWYLTYNFLAKSC